MNYNLADPKELKAARNRMSYLARKGSRCKLTEIGKPRTLRQNSYLHLLLGVFALETGYTIDEAKTIYKRRSADLYAYRKNGETFLKSTADLNVADMTTSIDRFRQFAAEQGIDLPAAISQEEMLSIENMMERNRRYL